MKKKKKKTKTGESIALVLNMIFEQVYPLWKQYKGNVPESEMKQLDVEGDFARGVTAICRGKAQSRQVATEAM